ncbi:FAD-dependent monooxygenase [Sulfitobacter sp. D35]|uniref:NAD(P)/FAD-dependent oxidoreductase n=1 Tax=Sulfitobacter sp. D35 TaxID=3083252 RepID=UPI00296E79B2|nr:FAD-dependent monooxygenase [Sulfitobacter sp. D35]MDW4500354.1 FAD-dependent monooxygenase [Sulfitobacter sp. D35]
MQTKVFSNDHYDAIIVGARCAGAATAMLLARAGQRVLVVDWAEEGSDTMSTHALMRGAVMQLDRWGVLPGIVAAGTPAIRRTTFQYGAQQIPLDIKPSHGVDALYAPRRTVLDAALVAAARAAGAELCFGISFRDVLRDAQGRVRGAVLASSRFGRIEVSADIVIGADGRRSSVARRVEARTNLVSRNRIACAYAYYEGIEDTGSHWLYLPRFAAGKIPTNDGAHCVFVALPMERFNSDVRGVLAEDPVAAILADEEPVFADMMRPARRTSEVTLFAGQNGHMRQCQGPGWALVGDAGYFKDPLTAHGITDALRDAESLAEAVLAGTGQALQAYQRDRDALSTELFDISDEIAGFGWSLPDLQALHMRLNTVMKQEQDWMATRQAETRIAA